MSACCPHTEEEHCKGGVLHARAKAAIGSKYASASIRCVGRHCEAPLCCCTSFREVRKPVGRVTAAEILRDATGAIPVALYSPFAVRR